MSESATVKLFLVLGSPTSIRTAELSNWTGKAVAGPRSQLDEILKRDEASKPGVYFLSGVNPISGSDRVYIGEAENIRSRVKSHTDRDFWKSIVFFVSKDENLTKAHIKYLEGKLITAAQTAGRYELENSQSSGAHLPESDAADMDSFYSRMEQLLPILGQDFLKPLAKFEPATLAEETLVCELKGCRAWGRRTDSGFVVLAGSEAVSSERPSTSKYPYAGKLRTNLIESGVVEVNEGKLVFLEDFEFSSPSAAASVVHGGQANGLTSWKNSAGLTLKEMEEQEIGNDGLIAELN